MSGGATREPDASRPGSVLRAEREALGISIREVAETLNLSLTVIEAIESDDLDRLPGVVFARGYVRAYARLLELEPGPLVAQYPRATDPAPPPEESTEPPIWEWIRRRPALVLGAAGGTLLVLLVLVLAWLWPDAKTEPAAAAVADAVAERPQPATEPPPLTAGADWIEPEPAPVEADEGPAELAASERPELAPGSAERPLVPEVPAEDVVPPAADTATPAAGVRRITDIGDDRLSFDFTDDCWVEVKSSSGANLYSDLNRAGTRLELVGQGPFRILLGYAPGARLTFNGEPVPLAPHTRHNVATLVLGQ